jgi:hypothetical protein
MDYYNLGNFLTVLEHIQVQMSANPDIANKLDLDETDIKYFNKGVDLIKEAVCNTPIINKITYKPGSQEEICIGTQYFTSELGKRQFSETFEGYGASEKEALVDLVEKLLQKNGGKFIFSLQ